MLLILPWFSLQQIYDALNLKLSDFLWNTHTHSHTDFNLWFLFIAMGRKGINIELKKLFKQSNSIDTLNQFCFTLDYLMNSFTFSLNTDCFRQCALLFFIRFFHFCTIRWNQSMENFIFLSSKFLINAWNTRKQFQIYWTIDIFTFEQKSISIHSRFIEYVFITNKWK